MRTKTQRIIAFVISVVAIAGYLLLRNNNKTPTADSLGDIPAFSGNPYIAINDNVPEFTQTDLTTEAYESYSELDALGRCGYAMACIGIELMPAEDRGAIGQIKPSGWHTVKYDFVDGKYLYNRCHLIGFQLTGENANERNLITGTRYMNVEGMLPFENMVADYIKETRNHVLYRVTPIFEGDNLVASGVQMEAQSVEDNGDGICFNVYVYNNQPGVTINYADGSSSVSESMENLATTSAEKLDNHYILNINSKKFHNHDCGQAVDISPENRDEFTGDRSQLIDMGYAPAKCCNP